MHSPDDLTIPRPPVPEPERNCVLAINGGSSSIKFAAFKLDGEIKRSLVGKIERIGMPGTVVSFDDSARHEKDCFEPGSLDFAAAGNFLNEWLAQNIDFNSVRAIGHRVVHGGAHYSEPQLVTNAVLDELRRISPYDPEHMPAEIALIELFRKLRPDMPQVACFDTAFHSDMPRVAQILPIPRKYEALGVRRYGFHGLSYAYLMEELARTAGPAAAEGRVILAHFGNGASLAAVKNGKSIDTSMAFTPTAGMVMGTRTGNLDPGLVWFLARTQNMSPEQFHAMVNHESGLLGVSETSSDMRDLEAREKTDIRAAEAVELFCYEARKWIGAYAAALGGLDTLVFAGGIGEHGNAIRERICSELKFLGIELDVARNASHAPMISSDASRVTVRVIPTDEELMIARAVLKIVPGS